MEYHLNPYDKLTPELIDKLIIHHTVSDLRRALERSPWIQKVTGTKDVPTIYYRKDSIDPNIDDWVPHALCMDLHRFTLNSISNNSNPPVECGYQSSIRWDEVSGVSPGNPLVTYEDNNLLIFDGYIAYDNCRRGNYVNVILTINEHDFELKKSTIRIEYSNQSYECLKSNIVNIPILFKIPGQEIPLKLSWDDSHITRYHICLTQESILL